MSATRYTETPPLTLEDNGSGDRRRVLLISYHFPPVGGAGVQRPMKFAKYLRDFGWDVTVLSAANPSVPVLDESLLRDLPDDLLQIKARTLEPGYALKSQLGATAGTAAPGVLQRLKRALRGSVKQLASLALQPDPQVLWHPAAFPAAKRLLREVPHDAILATAPSYSNLLLGARLKRQFDLPLIVDFRDEWDLSGLYLENSRHDWYSRWRQEQQQRHILRVADHLLATTPGSTARLVERAVAAGHQLPGSCIYNGFDPSDYADLQPTPRLNSGKLRIVYTGTLWNLTDIEPLVAAIELLHQRQPELLAQLELDIVGRKTPDQLAKLQRLSATRTTVNITDYCPHSEALQRMAAADVLCLLLSDVPGAERVVPAKLFEYLALSKPMLALAPHGATSEIVQQFGHCQQITPQQIDVLSLWLEARLTVPELVQARQGLTDPQAQLAPFTRRHQAGQLADVLNSVVDATTRGGQR